MASNDIIDQAGAPPGGERRANTRVGGYFDRACLLTEPLLGARQNSAGFPLTLSALRLLRESFPDLHQQDLAILFSAVKSFHITHRQARSLH